MKHKFETQRHRDTEFFGKREEGSSKDLDIEQSVMDAVFGLSTHPSHRLSVSSVSLCFQSPGVLGPGKHRGTEAQSFFGKREEGSSKDLDIEQSVMDAVFRLSTHPSHNSPCSLCLCVSNPREF